MPPQPILSSDSALMRLQVWAEHTPNRAALRFEGGSVSYAELRLQVQRMALALHQRGVRSGDTVALVMPSTTVDIGEQIAQLFGIAWLGACTLPFTSETSRERIALLAEQFKAKWIVSDGGIQTGGAQHIPRTALDNHVSGQPPPPCKDASKPFLYEFTSGTTGEAKAVLFTGTEYTQRLSMTRLLCNWQDPGCAMAPNVWPNKVGIRTAIRTLTLGGTHIEAAFPASVAQLRGLTDEFQLSNLTASPWQLRQLLASATPQPQQPAFPLLNLSAVGAAISGADIASARRVLTPDFYACYGATEIGYVACIGPDHDAHGPYHLHEAIEGGALDASGAPLPAGEMGRLRFRAPWVTQRYVPGLNVDSKSGFIDGWFVTSDLGAVGPKGALTLNGRMDDVINVGGAKVIPTEVEQVLMSHPGVSEAVVLSIPHPMAGEVAIAFVVLRQEMALATLTSYLHQHLDGWMVPADFIKIDQFPRNAGGKVDQLLLRTRYLATGRLG